MESNGSNNPLIYLLNIPNVRQHIFQYLPIEHIFRLKCASREIKLLIDEIYLPFELTNINIGMLYYNIKYGRRLAWNKNDCDIFQKGSQNLLTQTRSLRALNLTNCHWLIDKQLIDILNSNRSIKYLNVKYCSNLSSTALHSIIAHGRNVKVLNLINYHFNSHSLERIGLKEIKLEGLELLLDNYSYTYLGGLLQKCEHLRALTLHMIYEVPENAIILEILRYCKNLKMLRFCSGCLSIGDAFCGFSYLAGCKNIESLNLSFCRVITNRALNALSNLRNLKQLVLDGSPFTVKGIGYMTVCDKIEILSLNECSWVNDSVLEVISRYRNLRKLYVTKCYSITHTGISYLINRCSSLEEVFLSNKHDYFPQDCYQQSNVLIHVEEKHGLFPYYYCKTHRLQMPFEENYYHTYVSTRSPIIIN